MATEVKINQINTLIAQYGAEATLTTVRDGILAGRTYECAQCLGSGQIIDSDTGYYIECPLCEGFGANTTPSESYCTETQYRLLPAPPPEP